VTCGTTSADGDPMLLSSASGRLSVIPATCGSSVDSTLRISNIRFWAASWARWAFEAVQRTRRVASRMLSPSKYERPAAGAGRWEAVRRHHVPCATGPRRGRSPTVRHRRRRARGDALGGDKVRTPITAFEESDGAVRPQLVRKGAALPWRRPQPRRELRPAGCAWPGNGSPTSRRRSCRSA
jgi:hypothetical protein